MDSLIARTRRAVARRDALARPWVRSLVALGLTTPEATALVAYAIEKAMRDQTARASWPC